MKMETKKTKPQYTEWLYPEEMHEASLSWFSELNFMRDEQFFLNNLIKSFTLQLADSEVFEKSKKVVTDLQKVEQEIVPLFKKVQTHENQLEIMVDDVDQLKMEKAYLETHKELTNEMRNYSTKYRKIKERLFEVVSTVMKKDKQKRLLT